MKPRPPKAIEAVVGLLIPPVHREHVLGDLHERCTSPWQYLMDSVRTVPLVILSQIARTTAPRVLLMEACAVYGSFLAAVWLQGVWSQGTSFLFEQSEVLQLVIPAIAGLLALVVGDAYATPGIERRLRSTLGAALCVAFAFLSQAALSVSYPDLVTPRWIMILGGGMSLLLLSTLRLWFLPGVDRLRPAPVSGGVSMTHKEIRRKAQEFETKIKRRNRGEYIAVAVLVAIFGWQLASSANLIANIGGALIIAGALYVAHHLRKQGSAKTLPADAAFVNSVAFYRTELERQRDLLRRVWLWYLGPLIPGGVVMYWGLGAADRYSVQSLVGGTVVMLFLLLIGKLNKMAAGQLQHEIDELQAVRSQNEPEGDS